jgi:hypothetical protein
MTDKVTSPFAQDNRAALASYRRWAGANRFWYLVSHLLLVTCASATTVLVGVGANKWIAVGVSAVAAFVSATEQLFGFREKWLRYRTAHFSMEREIRLQETRTLHYRDAADPVRLLQEKLEAIRMDEFRVWQDQVRAGADGGSGRHASGTP